MHRELRTHLTTAVGSSHWVFVAVIDVRDFSRFAEERESVETSYYLRQTYIRLLDDYFADASFFKLTGDGLLLVFEHQPSDFEATAQNVLNACVRSLDDFSHLHGTDPMLGFPLPTQVGIGIARGAASRLESGEFTLDYAGRVLNLAARLMDLARPSGIVASGIPVAMLPDAIRSRFAEDRVFVRSVAEVEPINVLLTPDLTTIPGRNRQPLADIEWKIKSTALSRKDWERSPGRHIGELEAEPTSSREVKITGYFHTGRGRSRRRLSFDVPDFTYELHAGKPRVVILKNAIEDRFGPIIRPNTIVTIEVAYPTIRSSTESSEERA